VLDDAMCGRGTKRLGEQRDATLVDRRGAHLHRRRESDGGSDHDPLDPVERESRQLGRSLAGEVEPRRAGGVRRRAGDRSVDGLEPRVGEHAGDAIHGRRRHGVQVGDERPSCSRRIGDRGCDLDRDLGWDDGQEHVRRAGERRERADVLQGGLLDQPPRPSAATVERDHDPCAAGAKPRPEGAAHRSHANEPDDQRADPSHRARRRR
jgi:hypothetical protein